MMGPCPPVEQGQLAVALRAAAGRAGQPRRRPGGRPPGPPGAQPLLAMCRSAVTQPCMQCACNTAKSQHRREEAEAGTRLCCATRCARVARHAGAAPSTHACPPLPAAPPVACTSCQVVEPLKAAMSGLRSFLHSTYKNAAELVLPARSQSAFKEKGVSGGRGGPEGPAQLAVGSTWGSARPKCPSLALPSSHPLALTARCSPPRSLCWRGTTWCTRWAPGAGRRATRGRPALTCRPQSSSSSPATVGGCAPGILLVGLPGYAWLEV